MSEEKGLSAVALSQSLIKRGRGSHSPIDSLSLFYDILLSRGIVLVTLFFPFSLLLSLILTSHLWPNLFPDGWICCDCVVINWFEPTNRFEGHFMIKRPKRRQPLNNFGNSREASRSPQWKRKRIMGGCREEKMEERGTSSSTQSSCRSSMDNKWKDQFLSNVEWKWRQFRFWEFLANFYRETQRIMCSNRFSK